jgi:hypothetical protein
MSDQTLRGFSDAPYDGIMGLGKRKTTELNHQAFLEDMEIEGFTLCLGDPELHGDGIGGRLEMQSMLDVGNPYVTLSTIGKYVWGAMLDHVSVPGQPPLAHCSALSECASIIDSGTTLLLFPEPVVDSLYYTIEDGCAESDCLLTLQNQTTCSGPHFDGLPQLELRVGGQMLTLPPRVYMGEMEVDVPTTKEIKVGNTEVSVPRRPVHPAALYHRRADDIRADGDLGDAVPASLLRVLQPHHLGHVGRRDQGGLGRLLQMRRSDRRAGGHEERRAERFHAAARGDERDAGCERDLAPTWR